MSRRRRSAGIARRLRDRDLLDVSEQHGAFGSEQEATRIALERARRRADAAAAALGLRVVAIRKVDLNAEFGYDSPTQAARGGGTDDSGGGGSAAPEIEPASSGSPWRSR